MRLAIPRTVARRIHAKTRHEYYHQTTRTLATYLQTRPPTPQTSSDTTTTQAAATPTPALTPLIALQLSKPRLSGLVVLTTAAGHAMAQPAALEPATLAATLAGTFLCASSANTLNQIIEVDRDAKMARTARRPLPSGRVTPQQALAWAAASGTGGVAALALCAGPTTALLGVYTPMKPRTSYNTWVGAVVGAIPPLMGWTSAGASLVTPEALVLSSALFLWQIPHFMALAWMYRADYAAGGYRMVPLTDPTGRATSEICLRYSLYLSALPVGCWATGVTSFMFAVESIAFNGLMVAAALSFYRRHGERGAPHARRLFFASLAYLPFFFGALLLHQKPRDETDDAAAEASVLRRTSALSEARERVLCAGRALCLHELKVPLETPAGGRSCIVPAGPGAATPAVPSGESSSK